MAITATYSDAVTFTIAGDLTDEFHAGRRVRANCGVDGYKYATILSSSYSSPNTTVILTAGSDDLTANLAEVLFGIVGIGDYGSIPEHDHLEDEGDGGVMHRLNGNTIINGDMAIWQRGTTFTSPASGQALADMFKVFTGGHSGDVEITKDTDVPTQSESGHVSAASIKVDITTADDSLGENDYLLLGYRVEGYDLAAIWGKEVTLSFWVKSTKIGIFSIALCNLSDVESYSAEYEIFVTDTWEKKEVTFTLYTALGTWNYTNSIGLSIYFTLALGTGLMATALETWTTESKYGSEDQVNCLDDADNNFWLAQVKLEVGPVATPFRPKHFGKELALCQRYYEKSYELETAPGTATNTNRMVEYTTRNAAGNSPGPQFAVSKRATPTVVIYSTTGASGKVNNNGTDRATVVSNPGQTGISGLAITSGTVDYITWHFTADASL